MDFTHIGVRIEYRDRNSVLLQSYQVQDVSEVGGIALEVHPSSNADVFVAAVDSNRNAVVKLGAIRGITLVGNGVTTLTEADIGWTDAVWRLAGETSPVLGDANDRYSITLTGDRNQPWNTFLSVEVRDPFHVNQQLAYDEYLIGINGSGGIWENNDGWLVIMPW